MSVPRRRTAIRRALTVGAAAVGAWVMVLPPALAGQVEHSTITLQDEPVTWEFDDPCTGIPLRGSALEDAVIRITDRGEQGYQQNTQADGVGDFFDGAGSYVATWTYHVHDGDQFPPDAQGTHVSTFEGRVRYADGHTANWQLGFFKVFEKGDALKRHITHATCGGAKA